MSIFLLLILYVTSQDSIFKSHMIICIPVAYCWFSHDVTKFQTSKLLILLRFYFHDVQEQLKTNIHANFRSEWVLGLVIDYA